MAWIFEANTTLKHEIYGETNMDILWNSNWNLRLFQAKTWKQMMIPMTFVLTTDGRSHQHEFVPTSKVLVEISRKPRLITGEYINCHGGKPSN